MLEKDLKLFYYLTEFSTDFYGNLNSQTPISQNAFFLHWSHISIESDLCLEVEMGMNFIVM